MFVSVFATEPLCVRGRPQCSQSMHSRDAPCAQLASATASASRPGKKGWLLTRTSMSISRWRCTWVACSSFAQALACHSTANAPVLAANNPAFSITGVYEVPGETATVHASTLGQVPHSTSKEKGAPPKHSGFSTSFPKIQQKKLVERHWPACCSSPIATLSLLLQPFHDGSPTQKNSATVDESTAKKSSRSVLTEGTTRPTKNDSPLYTSPLHARRPARSDCTQNAQMNTT